MSDHFGERQLILHHISLFNNEMCYKYPQDVRQLVICILALPVGHNKDYLMFMDFHFAIGKLFYSLNSFIA